MGVILNYLTTDFRKARRHLKTEGQNVRLNVAW